MNPSTNEIKKISIQYMKIEKPKSVLSMYHQNRKKEEAKESIFISKNISNYYDNEIFVNKFKNNYQKEYQQQKTDDTSLLNQPSENLEIFLEKPKKVLSETSKNLFQLANDALSMKNIYLKDYKVLKNKERLIFYFFLKKKFNMDIEQNLDEEFIKLKRGRKTKRNEEVYKYGVKCFFKLYSNKTNQLKFNHIGEKAGRHQKIFIKIILKEISSFLKINFHQFLNNSFISKNDLMIRGIKRIYLYNKSPTFKKNIEKFYRNEFFDYVKNKRKLKITNLFFSLLNKVSALKNYEECFVLLEKIFNNKRFKIPWSDDELIFTQNFGIKYFCL